MVLVIGGAYQGKASYVKEKYDVEAKKCTPDEAMSHPAINCYHELIRDVMEKGEDPKEYTKRLTEKNPDAIVICDEVGMGIVPMDKDERIWREAVGRSLKILAQKADTVSRIYAGIEVRIK